MSVLGILMQPFTIRMPKEIHEKLTQWSNEEYRSINSLIVSILNEAIIKREKNQKRKEREEEE